MVRWRLPSVHHAVFSDQAADTATCRAMAQTKPVSSRALAVVTTLAGFGGPGKPAIAHARPDLRLPGDVADGPRLVLIFCRSGNSRLSRAGKR